MYSTSIQQRTIGVNFTATGEASVVLWAPLLNHAAIQVAGKNTLPLTQQDLGFWQLTTHELQPHDRYKFVLNNEQEFPDPTSLAQPEGVHGFSEAINIMDFAWTDENWQNLPLADYILYELHTGTFTPEGTFEAIGTKLDYLKKLGVNTIEIMPVAQFPGTRNWGYDGVFPFAVQHSYGGARGLQRLVDICHQKGIAVVLDVVYNHLGPEGNYLGAYGPFFTDKYNTPWGNALNFDDAWCDGVRQFFIENVLMWFRDFHVDALRLDAVHAIKDFSAVHILREIKMHVDLLMQETGRTHYLIVELDLNDPKFINLVTEQGFGMDAQWIDEFHHALRVAATGESTGYYSDFTGISHLAKAYQDAYVYDGQYSPHRFKKFGLKAEHNPGQQFIVFSQNHDQVGNRMLGERTSQLVSLEMQKLMAGAVLVSPYVPMLFMGEEYAEPHPFLYFVSHTDPDLVEAVRKGRKAEFAAFHALGEAPDPQSEATFNQSKLQWHLLDEEPHQTLFRYYQALIQLRQTNPALKNLNRHHLDVVCNENTKTLLLHRWHENQHVLCLLNFSPEVQSVTLPTYASNWQKLFDSAAPEWNGKAAAPDSISSGIGITLQPESLIIYQND
ncbi:malto-oligosyltrehalose trehalohydrolase [Adhaeribacter pallidiroseus]|uniref:Malto-oligosyltrehalose trehalohydrolase n=1 Tax=Adhaeribacter pallidiroseus TaxID=2072847 RepID=A0A369QEI1_9BACT|nr:malto-oligosyltrehalose trehalohydrolase [Adhaeribacter pallidiroseus]RDC62720.1 4-alpha-D-((1->4)-alpha-D-glucano)trehalose trehalohydrolase [Adhaeribacter pallidiroseus]